MIVLFLLLPGSRQSFSQGKIDKSNQEIKKGNKRESHQASKLAALYMILFL